MLNLHQTIGHSLRAITMMAFAAGPLAAEDIDAETQACISNALVTHLGTNIAAQQDGVYVRAYDAGASEIFKSYTVNTETAGISFEQSQDVPDPDDKTQVIRNIVKINYTPPQPSELHGLTYAFGAYSVEQHGIGDPQEIVEPMAQFVGVVAGMKQCL